MQPSVGHVLKETKLTLVEMEVLLGEPKAVTRGSVSNCSDAVSGESHQL